MDNQSSLYTLKKTRKLSKIKYNPYTKTTNLLFPPNRNKLSHSKYLKLYNISKSSENSPKKETPNETLKIKLKYKKKFEILKKIFQKPKKSQTQSFIKVTKAKSPFSKKEKIDPEQKKKKIKSLNPSKKFHDINTIKWLRHKYSFSLLEKSINTLLPDNGKPVIPEDESERDKKKRKLKEFLESGKPVNEREKNVDINPKYFFDKRTFEKVLKLKEIFLEFDEDGSRKMELDEMFTMFNQNNIFADLDELVKLFFKNKKINKKQILSLYLNFFQFMQFSLNKEQDFRIFMREIKEKYKKGKYKSLAEGNTYLPMSFNLMLDYFITKGKERPAFDAINQSIKDMDEILYKGLKKDKNLLSLNLSIFQNLNRRNSVNIQEKRILKRLSTIRNLSRHTSNKLKIYNSDDNSSSDEIEKDKNIKKLEKINFKEPIEEFEKIFKARGVNLTKNKKYEKKLTKLYNSTHNSLISENSTSYGKTPQGNILINKKIINIEDSISGNISKNISKNNEISGENSLIADIVNNNINKKFIRKMNKINYDKYHNIKIAIDTSNKEIDSIKKMDKNRKLSNNLKTNYNNYSKDNTDYSNISFLKNQKLDNIQKNNKYILNNSHIKNINPFIQYSSYFEKKNTKKMNKFPSSNKNRDFMINGYFTKSVGYHSLFNNTNNNVNRTNDSKVKLNKFNYLEKSISRIKNDYVPFELLIGNNE